MAKNAARAGYSPKVARQVAAENMTKPVIAEAIRKAKQVRTGRVQVDQDYVINKIKETLRGAPRSVRFWIRRETLCW
ncbi:terminase small subunit [Desulfurivibrio dismutans]|uniref:terminase small subunit n=1 Tax=Desulfurivibrio dismutans TaxID=1398908 RepID=UPI003D6580B2